MNRLTNEDRCRVLACLVEGNSIRSTVRITGIAKRTVSRLVVELGEACERFADRALRGLDCKSLQCDEIWAFCGAKEKNCSPEQKENGWGDVWTWIAIDPETKLIPAWYVADRSAESAYKFMLNVARRMTGRYSPPICVGEQKKRISGSPFPELISTSHAERNNLTIRMQLRRFTRLTNAFSKSVVNHRLALAIHFVHYNFARIHSSLRVTPAMAAGVSDRVWDLADIVSLLEKEELALAA